MAQSVDRLKELLFDAEARTLDTLTQRVEGIEQLALDERRRREDIQSKLTEEQKIRQDIARRVDEVFNRAGTSDRFEVSVAEVLDAALRRAEVDRHAELAGAMAPLMVRTVKTEIRNSRDELVEALYPMTGRMVQAYVASAMKDLAKDINRRLEHNPVMLRLRSLASGKSVAEMAIAESQRLVVEELYLIRRGTGELMGRWPEAEAGAGNRDHVMSGVLTAINEFSTEALKDDGSALRQIDLGERQLYLRVSPSFLLAAKCSGSAPLPVETVLDESFLEAMEELQKLPLDTASASGSKSTAVLAGLSQSLEQRLDEKTGELAETVASVSPIKLLAWIIGVPFIAWLGWTVYSDYRTERARSIAASTLASDTAINGYPISFDVSTRGAAVIVSGLAPAIDVKNGLIQKLREALPGSIVTERISVLPNDLAAVEPRIAGVTRDVRSLAPEVAQNKDAIAAVDPKIAGVRNALSAVGPQIESVRAEVAKVEGEFKIAAFARAMDRTRARLDEAKQTVAALAAAPGAPLDQSVLKRTAANIEIAIQSAGKLQAGRLQTEAANQSDAAQPQIRATSSLIREAELGLSALAGLSLSSATRPDTVTVDALSVEADRLANIALAAAQVIAVKRSIPPPPVIPAAIEPSARDRLVAFSRAYAVFFTNEADFRRPKETNAALDELARLMRGNDVLIRVVGYTDNQGTLESNAALSQSRSQAVIDALKARGVAGNRFVAVGRVDAVGISQERGVSSPNRRVEFEVGFVGEGTP